MLEKKKNTQKSFNHLGLLYTDLDEGEINFLRQNQSRVASYFAKYPKNSQQTLFEELDQEVQEKWIKYVKDKLKSGSHGRTPKVRPFKGGPNYYHQLRLKELESAIKKSKIKGFRVAESLLKNLCRKNKKRNATLTIEFFGYLLPKKFKEEALGDIYETRHDMEQNGWSNVSVFWVTFWKIVWVLISSLRTRLSDLVDSEKESNK